MACQRRLRFPGLCRRLKHEFIGIARGILNSQCDPGQAHLARLRGNPVLHQAYLVDSCSVCLLQESRYSLDCRHRLCVHCVSSQGKTVETWHRRFRSCPVCQRPNTTTFKLRPPTAGARILSLGGVKAENSLKFLEDLQRCIGVRSLALNQHFDEISGSGMGAYSLHLKRPDSNLLGMFFIITAFLEGWDLADCKFHLPKLDIVRLRQSTVTFGKGLSWMLDRVPFYNNAVATLKTKRHIFSNSNSKRDR